MDNVIRAILASHDYKTSEEQRAAAYRQLEQLKDNPNQCVQISSQLIQHSNPIIQHYAFHSIETLVKAKWNQFDQEQKEKLKEYSLRMMFPMGPHVQKHFLREKICDVITQIAFREWPQRWPNMLPRLFELAGMGRGRGGPGLSHDKWLSLMLIMIVRNLAGQIIAFDPNVPEKRCRQIQEGLQASTGPMRSLITSVLSYYLQLKPSSEAEVQMSKRGIKLALQAIHSVVDWVDPAFIYESEDESKSHGTILHLVFSAFNMGDHCVPASEILTIVCMKNTMSKYNPILKDLWGPVLRTVEMVLGTNIEDVHRKRLVVTAVIGPLSKLMRNHVDLIVSDTDIKLKKMRFKFLQIALRILNHEMVSIARRGVELWMHILRSKWNTLVDKDWQEDLVSKILEASLRQNTRRPYRSQTTEFETETEYLAEFAGLRSQIHVLMENVVAKHPPLAMSRFIHSYTRILRSDSINTASSSANSGISSGSNANGAITKENYQLCNAIESHSSGIEHMIRAIPKEFKTNSSILDNLGGMLRCLLSLKQNQTPVIMSFCYSSMGLLHPLYHANDQALKAALLALIQGVQYRPAGCENVVADELDKDTLIARKRALTSLIAITKKQRSQLAPVFSDLTQMVRAAMNKSGGKGWLRDEERMALLECLLPISNALAPEAQLNFIKSIIIDPLKTFDLHAQNAFRETKSFVTETGLGSVKAINDSRHRQTRQEIWWALDLLRAIFRQLSGRGSESALILPNLVTSQRILSLLFLTGCCNRLISPSSCGQLIPEVRAALEETREKMEEAKQKLPRNVRPIVKELHTWFRTVRACAYSLLGFAAKYKKKEFFQVADSSRLGLTAFGGSSTMPPIYLKVILDQLLPNILQNYPLNNAEQARSFQQCIGSIFSSIFSRLGNGWSKLSSSVTNDDGKGFRGAELEEIRSVSTLTDLQRSFVHCLCDLFCVPPGVAGIRYVRNTFYPPSATSGMKNLVDDVKRGEKKKRGKELNPYVPSPDEIRRSNVVVELILSDQRLLNLIMTIFMALMIWPDSNSGVTACTLVLRFVPPMIKSHTARSQAGNLMIKAFETSMRVLGRLRKEIEEAQHGAHMGLLKEMYHILVPLGLNGLREMFQRIPGLPPDELRILEQTIVAANSDKVKRRAFKRFLTRYVVGLQANAGRHFAVQDLPEGFVAACKGLKARDTAKAAAAKVGNDDDDDEDPDPGLEWLFGDT